MGDSSKSGFFSSDNIRWLEHLADKRINSRRSDIKTEESPVVMMEGVTSNSH